MSGEGARIGQNAGVDEPFQRQQSVLFEASMAVLTPPKPTAPEPRRVNSSEGIDKPALETAWSVPPPQSNIRPLQSVTGCDLVNLGVQHRLP